MFAFDAAGNASATDARASGTALADTTAPAVWVTAPAAGAIVKSIVSVAATASDNVSLAGVQFKLDGADARRGGHVRALLGELGHRDGDRRRATS